MDDDDEKKKKLQALQLNEKHLHVSRVLSGLVYESSEENIQKAEAELKEMGYNEKIAIIEKDARTLYCQVGDTLYVASRGTVLSCFSDLRADLAPGHAKDPTGSYKAHMGFLIAVEGNKRQNEKIFNDIIDRLRSDTDLKLVFTGHSLGGAKSTILLQKFLHAFDEHRNCTTAYTFGSPAIGERDTQQYFDNNGLSKLIFNVMNENDIVVRDSYRFGSTEYLLDKIVLAFLISDERMDAIHTELGISPCGVPIGNVIILSEDGNEIKYMGDWSDDKWKKLLNRKKTIVSHYMSAYNKVLRKTFPKRLKTKVKPKPSPEQIRRRKEQKQAQREKRRKLQQEAKRLEEERQEKIKEIKARWAAEEEEKQKKLAAEREAERKRLAQLFEEVLAANHAKDKDDSDWDWSSSSSDDGDILFLDGGEDGPATAFLSIPEEEVETPERTKQLEKAFQFFETRMEERINKVAPQKAKRTASDLPHRKEGTSSATVLSNTLHVAHDRNFAQLLQQTVAARQARQQAALLAQLAPFTEGQSREDLLRWVRRCDDASGEQTVLAESVVERAVRECFQCSEAEARALAEELTARGDPAVTQGHAVLEDVGLRNETVLSRLTPSSRVVAQAQERIAEKEREASRRQAEIKKREEAAREKMVDALSKDPAMLQNRIADEVIEREFRVAPLQPVRRTVDPTAASLPPAAPTVWQQTEETRRHNEAQLRRLQSLAQQTTHSALTRGFGEMHHASGGDWSSGWGTGNPMQTAGHHFENVKPTTINIVKPTVVTETKNTPVAVEKNTPVAVDTLHTPVNFTDLNFTLNSPYVSNNNNVKLDFSGQNQFRNVENKNFSMNEMHQKMNHK
ncbi:Lipase (class 3), putative [Angomonas deanei]|uniref:Lipase (Class 3), putative n=1 Tax=Angomonas deanei TaxID=59799 RepID=A0A7G2CUG6_9TRYP|nr:Lipase (class 3), putative [Angomonas deanei]